MTDGKVYAEGARASETPLEEPESKILTSKLASLTTSTNRGERRKMFRLLEKRLAVPGYSPISMDSRDPHTVECGFKKRLLRDVPEPNNEFLEEFKAFVYQWCSDNLPQVQPMQFEEWLSSTSYTEPRKDELRLAYDQNKGSRPSAATCSRVSTFVKSEFYPALKHCRMINSRCDQAKVFFGPRVKAVEKVVFELPQFIKHVPVQDRPAYILRMKQAGRKYYATDYTAFESHFTPAFLDACECQLFRWCLQSDDDCEFMCQVLMGKNIMKTRTGIKASVHGRRMSGDMNTSLGNGFSNYLLSLFLVHKKGGEMDGVFEGDDGLFYSTVELTGSDYEKIGFTIKIEEVSDPCAASFCGMIFSESGEIIRDPRKFFQGFAWTSSCIHGGRGVMNELLRAKSLSAVYETPQCPIVGALSRRGLALTRGVTPRFIRDGYHDVIADHASKFPRFSPSPDTRQLFAKMYGISPTDQIVVEDMIQSGDMGAIAMIIPPTEDQEWYTSRYVCEA